MPVAFPLKAAFNAGELSPRMAARVDFSKYANAAAVMRNLLALPQGGAARRPGTRHVVEVKDSTARTRLIDFRFSTEQAYQIEAGDRYFRFMTNQAQIAVPATGAAISNGDFTGNITGWDDRSTGTAIIAHDATNDRLSLVNGVADIAWAEQSVTTTATGIEHVVRFRVIGAAGDSVELRIGDATTTDEVIADRVMPVGFHTVAFTPTVSPFFLQFRNSAEKTVQIDDVAMLDDEAVEVTTPYATTDLFAIQKTQSADVMFMAHPDHAPHKLERRGNTTWSVVEVAWEDGPYFDENTTATTLTAAAVTGLGITVTASSTAGINDGAGFTAADIGRALRIQHTTTEPGWAVITGITSTTIVTVDIKRDFNATTASDIWFLGAWSDATGYPGSIMFFEQRLWTANTTAQPQTFWASQVGGFEFMRPDSFVGGQNTVQSDDGLAFTLAANQVNAIRWIAAGRDLVLGTAGGEWVVTSSGAAITPADIDVSRQTTYGSAAVEPVLAGNVVLFVQRAARKLREMVFNFDVDGYVARDLTILADHVTRGGIVEMAYQQEPDTVNWCVREDGVVAALTYGRAEEVVGWTRHFLGGSFGAGDAVVETVSVIPGDDDPGQVYSSISRDEVWFIVKRTVDGATVRYIEFMEALFEGPVREDFETEADFDAAVIAAQADAFCVDSGITYDGAATTAISGLDHLEGETVKILADGAVHPDRIVSAGAITLDIEASKVQVGLGYRHRYKSLKWNFGAGAGTAVAKTKRIKAAAMVLLDSGAVDIGSAMDDLKTVTFREVGDAMDTAVPLFTGEHEHPLMSEWGTDVRVFIDGDAPLPFVLLAIAPEMKTNEK